MDPVSSIPKKTFSLTEKLDHLKQLIKDLNPYQRSLLGMALLLFGFLAAIAVAQQTQDIRQRASSSSPISSPVTPTPISAPITPTPNCNTAPFSVSVSPTNISVAAGTQASFSFTINNNDTNCPPSDFTFRLQLPPNLPGPIAMPKFPVSISASSSYTNNVYLYSSSTTPPTLYPPLVFKVYRGTTTDTTPVTTAITYELTSPQTTPTPTPSNTSCNLDPTLTLSSLPSVNGQPATAFSGQITSNDTSGCSPITYLFSASGPLGWGSKISTPSAKLLTPGATTGYFLEFTPPKNAQPGNYSFTAIATSSATNKTFTASNTYNIPTPPPLENLLQNPSFETDAEKNFIPDFWTAVAFGRNGFVDCSVAQQGSCSLVLSRSQYYPIFGLGRKTVRQRINISANTGDVTKLSLYYRLKGTTTRTRGEWHIKLTNVYTNGTSQSVVRNLKTNGQTLEHEFQNLQMSIIAKRNLRSVIVEFSYNMNEGAMWIDNTRLYINRVNSPTPTPAPKPF